MKTYDHILLGTGQATGTLLGRLIPTGESIAVIEGGKVGGSCVNYGCTPTKTMVASAKALHQARHGDFFGFETGEIIVNYARVRERMNEIRNGGSDGLTNWMEGTDTVDLIRGWGEFSGPKTLRVNGEEITGKKIYINTGTHPFVPPPNTSRCSGSSSRSSKPALSKWGTSLIPSIGGTNGWVPVLI
ncbi:MAG: FAD-dependent oxidoreductase [Bacteroidota bacterium]